MFGHPWRRLRELAHITLHWADLPEHLMGFAHFETDTIVLSKRLNQAERRVTCAHEVTHLLRGPVPPHLREREERAVEEIVARDLIPFDALVQAMLWSLNDYEVADELTVDVALVRVRLHTLTAQETETLNHALDEGELRIP